LIRSTRYLLLVQGPSTGKQGAPPASIIRHHAAPTFDLLVGLTIFEPPIDPGSRVATAGLSPHVEFWLQHERGVTSLKILSRDLARPWSTASVGSYQSFSRMPLPQLGWQKPQSASAFLAVPHIDWQPTAEKSHHFSEKQERPRAARLTT
jgi:hypothetical protein